MYRFALSMTVHNVWWSSPPVTLSLNSIYLLSHLNCNTIFVISGFFHLYNLCPLLDKTTNSVKVYFMLKEEKTISFFLLNCFFFKFFSRIEKSGLVCIQISWFYALIPVHTVSLWSLYPLPHVHLKLPTVFWHLFRQEVAPEAQVHAELYSHSLTSIGHIKTSALVKKNLSRIYRYIHIYITLFLSDCQGSMVELISPNRKKLWV